MKKKLMIAAATAALSICAAFPALALGWDSDATGWYYVYESGNRASNGWRTIDDVDYYFDANGYMVTGWCMVDYEWRYFRPDGTMANSGWQMDNGKWYYFDTNGRMRTGWLELKNKSYYFNEDGSMAIGAKEIDGQNYFFDENGVARKGGKVMNQGGVKYRYKDKILQRYNTVTEEWEPVPGEKEALGMIMEALRDDYIDNHKYPTEAAFEAAAKQQLASLLSEEEINEFIEEVELEFNDIYDVEEDF